MIPFQNYQTQHLNKLKIFKNVESRIIVSVPKSLVVPSYIEKFWSCERQKINFIRTNGLINSVSFLQQGRLSSPIQQTPSLMVLSQSDDKEMMPQDCEPMTPKLSDDKEMMPQGCEAITPNLFMQQQVWWPHGKQKKRQQCSYLQQQLLQQQQYFSHMAKQHQLYFSHMAKQHQLYFSNMAKQHQQYFSQMAKQHPPKRIKTQESLVLHQMNDRNEVSPRQKIAGELQNNNLQAGQLPGYSHESLKPDVHPPVFQVPSDPSPSTWSTPSAPGNSEKPFYGTSSVPNNKNFSLQPAGSQCPAPETAGDCMSSSPSLAGFANANGTYRNALTTDFGKLSLTEQPHDDGTVPMVSKAS